MRMIKTLALFLFMATSLAGVARQVTDTLTSHEGDRVILTYDLEEKDRTVEIRFIKVNKRLSTDHSEKYGYDLSYIKVVCFDRDNRLQDIVIASTGLNPRQFMIPKGLSYTTPNDDKGYFFLDEELPVLRFESHVADSTILSIPVFLARYKKPHHYELFAQCGNLEITIGQQKADSQMSDSVQDPESNGKAKDDFIDDENDVDFSEIDSKALAEAKYIMEQLEKEKPDYEGLKPVLSDLGIIKQEIQNKEVFERIEETEQAFEQSYKNYWKGLQKEQVRLDSINEVERRRVEDLKNQEKERQDELEKRRNTLMIVGVVLLAVLMFVGNQVMQSIRNKKMEKKQQDAMKKAQEALQQQQQQANGEIPDQTPKRYTI